MKKRYQIIILIISSIILIFPNISYCEYKSELKVESKYIVSDNKENVSASDVVKKFKKDWKKEYKKEETSGSRESLTNLLGKDAISYVDDNYEKIKITKEDCQELDDKELAMVIGLLQLKRVELKKNPNYDTTEINKIEKNINEADAILVDKQTDNKLNELQGEEDKIYKQPELADSNTNSVDSIDGLISDSEKFINKGEDGKVNDKSIQDFSKTMYNILITIATVVSVLVGGILGIKIMIASAEEKAQVKELLVPYIIGCVVVFGAFGIWKLVVTILQNM